MTVRFGSQAVVRYLITWMTAYGQKQPFAQGYTRDSPRRQD